MVSVKTCLLSMTVTLGVVQGQMVNQIADRLAKSIINARSANVPESQASADVHKLVGFVTTDQKISQFYENALKTVDAPGKLEIPKASELLHNGGSVLAYATKKPDFNSMVNIVKSSRNKYDVTAIAQAAAKEVGPHIRNAYVKIMAASSSDAGVASLVNSISAQAVQAAQKALLSPPFAQYGVKIEDSAVTEQLYKEYPELKNFWVVA